jgi:ATP-dependent Clp protease ATP-binding subunit ClpA
MFQRFTEEAREVVVRAQREADTLGHDYLGTEHLLLGLASDEGPAGAALRSLGVSSDELRESARPRRRTKGDEDALAMIGIDLDEVRSRVEAAFGPGALERTRAGRRRLVHRRPLGPLAKRTFELSLREALHRGDRRIGSEHVLLGLLRAGRGPGVELLEQRGLAPEAVRAAVLRELSRVDG